MSNYIPENYRDIFRLFQVVAQGDAIADVTKFLSGPPVNPSFFLWGRNLRFRVSQRPEGYPIQILTDENRTSFLLIKNSALIDFQFDVTDFSYNGILDWFLTLHNTDFNPRAGFFSRKPGAQEYFKQFYGIIPNVARLIFPENNEPVRLVGSVMACKPLAEDTAGPTIGAGSYAPAITTTPTLPTDGGGASFLYNATGYKTKGMEIGVQMQYAPLDPDESFFMEHMKPTGRDISGNVNIFKKQGADAMHADILAKTVRSMSRILRPFNNPTNGTRIDLGNVLLSETDDDDYMSIKKTESVMKNYSFSAGSLTLTNLTS